MRLRYTLPALADLASILDYVVDPYPNSRCHRSVLRYPLAGAVTDDPTVRRMMTKPYPYLIYYGANWRQTHGSHNPETRSKERAGKRSAICAPGRASAKQFACRAQAG